MHANCSKRVSKSEQVGGMTYHDIPIFRFHGSDDVFKNKNAQAARENMEHCGQVCLLCCYGASVANCFMYC